jgi:predicted nucleic acid-binding protein
MTRPTVIDSTVLLAFCDPDDPLHREARAAVDMRLTVGSPLVVPVTVLSEVLVGAFRSTPHAVRTVEAFVDELVDEVYPVDRPTGRAAAKYRADHPGLGMSPALVLGTAKVIAAEQILTTEETWIAIDTHVHLVSPERVP